MAAPESPLITAIPPQTDYISYLAIVEHYLTLDTLPILHKVLQDETLTTNIGWDLVHVLTPYLPASTECLYTIARLGNPREVILKVTEALQLMDYNERPHTDKAESDSDVRPLFVDQIDTLLAMLEALHARIKTKYPSRFLSTTLQAVLSSLTNAPSHKEDLVPIIVRMTKKIRGIQRPTLPSRSSSNTLSRTTTNTSMPAAKDPEAVVEVSNGPEEEAIQLRLFQAFITHILEDYLLTLQAVEGIPGLAWSTRIMETIHAERIIPHSKTMSSRFQNEETLYIRNDTVGQLISVAHDLRLTDEALLEAITLEEFADPPDDDEPPASSSDIPLSRLGSVLLYTTRRVSDVLHGRQQQKTGFAIFPDHNTLLSNSLSAAATAMIGTEPEALIDACLVLGLLAVHDDKIGTPRDDTQYIEYLQITSLLAANCPNANLRGHAHYLVSTILRSHPDDKVRYMFIRDTLEDCPFENLKTTAVGWLKGEIIESSMTPAATDSTFGNPITLEHLAPCLFPALQAPLLDAELQVAWSTYQTNISFYTAILNFLYLLITAKQLRQKLEIQDLWKERSIPTSFIQPLIEASQRFTKAVDSGEVIDVGDITGQRYLKAELNVLQEAIDRVMIATKLFDT